MKYLVVLVVITGLAFGGNIDKNLAVEMALAEPGEQLPVMIIFDAVLDMEYINTATAGMDYWARREFVVNLLMSKAETSQSGVLKVLENSPAELVSDIKPFWIVNGIYCKATTDVINSVMDAPGVAYLEFGRTPREGNALIDPMNIRDVENGDVSDGTAWGVTKVNAPSVWGMGYDGDGIIVSIVDTGVNYNHLDLQNHMWSSGSYTNGWDFFDGDSDPMDDYGHGTHCAGSVASDGSAGTNCGVAPGAIIMALRINYYYGGESTWIEAFEFSTTHGARVISTSLGTDHGSMAGTMRQAQENLLAAGLCHSIAAGNSGPGSQTIGNPGDCPPPWLHPDQTLTGGLSAVTTVGATDSNDNIASFSSRGHSTWQSDAPWYDYPDSGGGLIDPDIAAPGVNITSCTWPSNSGYTTMDGTSMATPHVAGVMALLLDAVPSLTPADVEYYMEMNALELGASGKDNTYGAGRVDAYDAVSAALGGTGTTDDQIGVVSTPGILLSPVTPNPVMASAQFTVSTGSTCPADISIFDISGRKVAVIQNGEMEAGAHAFRWTPPSGVSNGIYFVQVVSQGELVTERFTIIR